MAIEWALVWDIAGPCVGASIGVYGQRLVERRPVVLWFVSHASGIPVRSATPVYNINTHTIYLRNTGKRSATNVRVTHNTLPEFTVFPPESYSQELLPGGQTDLIFPLLRPGQELTVSYVYTNPLVWNQIHFGVQHDEGRALEVRVKPQLEHPKWVWVLSAVLIFSGAITVLYLAARMIMAVVPSLLAIFR